MTTTENMRLTQFSHGAGCGCKISPAVLDRMLHSEMPRHSFPHLLVGNETRDDAAVYALDNDNCIISTTDFFMPIVDDPFTFGAIASVNAISDIYAMGGEPLMAIAILGWPVSKIPAEVASIVLDGSRKICREAGIPLAGGHSIDCPEPVFGLAVTGKARREHLKRNDTATADSLLYLTKPLGVGIITTAEKKGIVQPEHLGRAVESMLKLNSLGSMAGRMPFVTAMTDVTGFGLLGHLSEVCEASGLSAEIEFEKIPAFDFLAPYIEQKSIPGGTNRNWESYGSKISSLPPEQLALLADPQTSGGLLMAVEEGSAREFERAVQTQGYQLVPFGKLVKRRAKLIVVN